MNLQHVLCRQSRGLFTPKLTLALLSLSVALCSVTLPSGSIAAVPAPVFGTAPYAGVASATYAVQYPSPEKWSYEFGKGLAGGVSLDSSIVSEVPAKYTSSGTLSTGAYADRASAEASFDPWKISDEGVVSIKGSFAFTSSHDSPSYMNRNVSNPYYYSDKEASVSYGQYWVNPSSFGSYSGPIYGFVNVKYDVRASQVPDPVYGSHINSIAGASVWYKPSTYLNEPGSQNSKYVSAAMSPSDTSASSTGVLHQSISSPNQDFGIGIRFNPNATYATYDPVSINPSYQRAHWSGDFDVDIVIAPTQQLLCEEILRNSVSVRVENDKIRATFTPKYGLTLAQAAEICGVKSFNWVNTFSFPEGYRIWKVPLNEQGAFPLWEMTEEGTPLLLTGGFYNPSFVPLEEFNGPIVDPILDSVGNRHMVTGPGVGWNAFRGFINTGSSTDGLPFYYDEYSPLGADPGNHVGTYTSQDSLRFFDQPSIGESLRNDGLDHITFRTMLVGLREDGTFMEWGGLGTNFEWKSNRTHLDYEGTDSLYLLTLEGEAPLYLSGGIFDVRLDNVSVPEPPAHFLAIASLIAVFIASHRTRRSRHSC